jgi:KUP system potassium uptake protein
MAQADAGATQAVQKSKAGAPAEAGTGSAGAHTRGGGFVALLLGSIGVVFGDIGTSPIYAFRESLHAVTGVNDPLERYEVIGLVSLIFWALILVVTLKYVFILMRLDNKGEGGTLSLMALAQRALERRTAFIFTVGVVGAALFYGDAVITPAISVLSAVEGLKVVPALNGRIDPWILPISVGILVALFAIQSRGAGRVGSLFGPITVVWFLAIGALGALHIRDDPSILQALNPAPGLTFLARDAGLAFKVLGLVFLAVTGAEALYADMGHFGRRSITYGWTLLVLPCLTLNYLGQGAFVLHNPAAVMDPFFLMAPGWTRILLVLLATAATVIASQAVITGAFSITQQAIQLGILPRMEIRRTSETQAGQIFMPQVNGLLLVGVLVLLLSFRTSAALASAYGISVTGAMLTSTLLAYVAIWKMWRQPPWVAALIVTPFVLIEFVFLSSNMVKVMQGGFVPLTLGVALVMVMWTWVRGNRILADTTRREESLAKLFETLAIHPPQRVRGTAIFLTADQDAAPAALLHNLKHNQVLHEQIIILTVKTLNQPRVSERDRVKIEEFMPDVKRVVLNFGFMETPNIVKALTASRKQGLKFDIMKTSFFLSRRTVISSEKSGMPRWQDHLFIFLTRNSTNATDFFHIPSGRAVELGNQVMV